VELERAPSLTPGSLWPARYARPLAFEHHLRAKVGEMKRRGEIDPRPHSIYYRREGDEIVAYVLRMKPPPKRMPRVVAWLVTIGVSVFGVAWLLWESRYVILALLFAAAGIWWAATRATHSGACPGLHCSGCRG
jgi:hypothetical protein